MEWISVEDRLPEVDILVLVRNDKNLMWGATFNSQGILNVGGWNTQETAPGWTYDICSWCACFRGDDWITHWAYLSEISDVKKD